MPEGFLQTVHPPVKCTPHYVSTSIPYAFYLTTYSLYYIWNFALFLVHYIPFHKLQSGDHCTFVNIDKHLGGITLCKFHGLDRLYLVAMMFGGSLTPWAENDDVTLLNTSIVTLHLNILFSLDLYCVVSLLGNF